MATLLLLFMLTMYSTRAADLGCKLWRSGPFDYVSDPIGVCLATQGVSGAVTYTTSTQYVCTDDGNGGYQVELKEYTNLDCTEEDDTVTNTAQADSDYFDCTRPGIHTVYVTHNRTHMCIYIHRLSRVRVPGLYGDAWRHG